MLLKAGLSPQVEVSNDKKKVENDIVNCLEMFYDGRKCYLIFGFMGFECQRNLRIYGC